MYVRNKKVTINDKRLTKKQVKEIIDTEGWLHQEYTEFFKQQYAGDFVQQDKVYELPGERYLYVFDEKGLITAGKGDIYPKEYFLKMIKWRKRVKEDYANSRGSSVAHWLYYSAYKTDLINHISQLVADLAIKLNIELEKLDGSYKSLDLISAACQHYDLEQLFRELYDNLVAYTGEVILKEVNGFWASNHTHSGPEYPFISIGFKNVQYMPVNVVWDSTLGLEDIDIRKEATNEVRRNASRVKFEKRVFSKS